MATTYHDSAFGARSIGERTNAAGAAVDDVSAEEDRYAQEMYAQGILEPLAAFVVAADSGWNVTVGSGGSKTDYAVVGGVNVGQGKYIVRLIADDTIAVNASDPALDRIDEIYLVVQDNAYDASGRALPRLAYRDGTAAASPSVPGPDGTWDAYFLLGSILIPGGSANIGAATITDERTYTHLNLGGGMRIGFDELDNTHLMSPAATDILAKIGGVEVAAFTTAALEMRGNDITGVGDIDGMDISAHAHTGADGSVQMAHANLTGLTSGDPHSQYVLDSDLTKAAIDALNVDADTLDGVSSSGFATSGHNHTGVYLPIGNTAAAATKWATSRTLTLTGDATGSIAMDGTSNVSLNVTVANDSHTHNGTYYTESESRGRFYGASSDGGSKLTISSSAASGGSNGDIWLRY